MVALPASRNPVIHKGVEVVAFQLFTRAAENNFLHLGDICRQWRDAAWRIKRVLEQRRAQFTNLQTQVKVVQFPDQITEDVV
jgi:hypothetical protein